MCEIDNSLVAVFVSLLVGSTGVSAGLVAGGTLVAPTGKTAGVTVMLCSTWTDLGLIVLPSA